MCSDLPIYDGIEDYYKFRRRWDKYIQNKRKKSKYDNILKFINLLFNTDYKSLAKMKKITYDMIPSTKKIAEIMSDNPDMEDSLKLRCNEAVPTSKLIDTLLSRINFSFVEIDNGKEIYFSVKLYRNIPND